MKLKLGSIIAAVSLVAIAWMVLPRLTFWISAGPHASEPARESQATPVAAVETMFQMMQPAQDPGNLMPAVGARFNSVHLIEGKEMTSEEQAFSQLFWDARRCGVLYDFMSAGDAESPREMGDETNGDSASVKVSVTMEPPNQDEPTSVIFTFDLKKRGPNWYVYELKVPKAPDGVFNHVKSSS
jgi:hypothetical protein